MDVQLARVVVATAVASYIATRQSNPGQLGCAVVPSAAFEPAACMYRTCVHAYVRSMSIGPRQGTRGHEEEEEGEEEEEEEGEEEEDDDVPQPGRAATC